MLREKSETSRKRKWIHENH